MSDITPEDHQALKGREWVYDGRHLLATMWAAQHRLHGVRWSDTQGLEVQRGDTWCTVREGDTLQAVRGQRTPRVAFHFPGARA